MRRGLEAFHKRMAKKMASIRFPHKLRQLEGHMRKVALYMREEMPEDGNAQRHAAELEGAAGMIRQWVEELEEARCDHAHWSFEKHGRICTCGKLMWDAGD